MGAFKGVIIIFKNERYVKIVCFYGVSIILLAIILNASLIEIAVLVITITVVLVAEIFNAVVENIMDIVKPYKDHHIKILKETSAGMVLISSFGAAIVGGVIFLPKIIAIFK
ncbi:MAG: diacylglycerol kinase family protein [Candidatus Omnitrophota bacterium]|jgi:diacylglycerol kinase